MGKWQIGIVFVFLVAYSVTVLATGNPVLLIPAGILFAILMVYAGINWSITRRQQRIHGGDIAAEMADNEDPIPASHLIPDDVRPTGDTPEAHDEISPHDVPLSSPARRTVIEQAGGLDDVTRGNESGAAGGPADAAGASDDTAERTGEPQRSADHAA